MSLALAQARARRRYERACERMEAVHCLVGSRHHRELVMAALDELDDAICVMQEFNVNGAAGDQAPAPRPTGGTP